MVHDIGYVLTSDFIEGICVRVTNPQAMSSLRIGQLIVIESSTNEWFYAQINNLHTAWFHDLQDQPILHTIPKRADLMQLFIENTISVRAVKAYNGGELLAVRSIPLPGLKVRFATEEDIALIYGPRDGDHIYLGEPLEMNVPVVINAQQFIERSNGIFGKSGTGKSFLARIVLAQLIHGQKVANLIFDMHNEYGWESRSEQGSGKVKGLRQLFPGQVLIFTLDPEASKARGVKPDHVLNIAPEMITVDDIALLSEELDLSQPMLDGIAMVQKKVGDGWMKRLTDIDPVRVKDDSEFFGVGEGTLLALHRKLHRITALPFLRESSENHLQTLALALQSGKTVILEFGHQNSVVTYMLVANILTRLIYQRYVHATEQFMQSQQASDKVIPLMIVIEEAHKFLQGRVARSTTFGTIAREMRKYSVTLLIIDQRPSSIDREILSQIGTRIVAMLNDPDDIEAVFTGVSDKQSLKYWLSTLDSKKQVLLLGHALPIPTQVRVCEYDEEFYKTLQSNTDKAVEELFG
ncbi:MAG: ATP-binding protein [Candidatus Abawacabacteria bacterium]|nr:ATP-binding protein [Candidatus Abawacabacteria bacterium]